MIRIFYLIAKTFIFSLLRSIVTDINFKLQSIRTIMFIFNRVGIFHKTKNVWIALNKSRLIYRIEYSLE